jgi:hypothetical protein
MPKGGGEESENRNRINLDDDDLVRGHSEAESRTGKIPFYVKRMKNW